LKKKIILIFLAILVVGSGAVYSFLEIKERKEINYRLELIREIQEFEKKFGFKETSNFKEYDPETEVEAFYLCYFTEKTVLPHSHDDPQLFLRWSKEEFPKVDSEKYDIFYYRAEALAGKREITEALLKTSLSRMLMVVVHEDFHEQMEYPSGIEEPLATLVSILLAQEFAKEKFGKESEVYKNLEKKLKRWTELSPLFIKYFGLLSELYLKYQQEKITLKETLLKKEDLYKALAEEIRQKTKKEFPYPLNNALLAFAMTCIRYFPLAYQVYLSTNQNLSETIEIFLNLPIEEPPFDLSFDLLGLEEIKKIEKETERYLKEIIKSQS